MNLPPLEVKVQVNASAEQVFSAFTKPELLKQWWCTPGFAFRHIEMDVRPSGKYRLEVFHESSTDATNGCIIEGQFLEVVPSEKLVYTWSMTAPGIQEPDTTVTVLLKQESTHTELTLIHTGFSQKEVYALHELDWPIALSNLAELLQAHTLAV